MEELENLNNTLKRPLEIEKFEPQQDDIEQEMQNAKNQLDQKQSGSSTEASTLGEVKQSFPLSENSEHDAVPNTRWADDKHDLVSSVS